MRVKHRSIRVDIRTSLYTLTLFLILPVAISLIVMLYSADSYQRSISRMETVTSIMPVISEQIPEYMWSVVAGRQSFEDGDVYGTIDRVNTTLNSLIASVPQGQYIELSGARRTMETLRDYVSQIETGMTMGRPVVVCEAILEEVRSVAALIQEMLNNYISREIGLVSRAGVALHKAVLVATCLELLLVIFTLFITFRMNRHLCNSIHEPLVQLEHFAGEIATGNLRARAPDTSVTELSALIGQVNTMAMKLETLMEQRRQEQINLQKAELRTLQAQINPHFLYNTLDTILWQAEAGKSSEVILLTKALSDFFRISLSAGEDWVTVSQEFRHLSGYLAIQKKRYRDILDYSINVDSAMNDCVILKLLLQPLVENALYHGIKYKRGGGNITITGCIRDNRMHFEVRDDGRGMTQEQLERVLAAIHADPAGKKTNSPDLKIGFGLCNVDQRIRLYYNQPRGLSITSGAEGTTVCFSVPIRGREELKHD